MHPLSIFEDPKVKRINNSNELKLFWAVICFRSSAVKCFLWRGKMSKLLPYHLLLGIIKLSCL